jgi:hypothetical protein
VSKGSEAVQRHRKSKLGAGWVRIDGLLPPESAQAARAMIEAGVATSLIHAAAVALSRNPYDELLREYQYAVQLLKDSASELGWSGNFSHEESIIRKFGGDPSEEIDDDIDS